MRKIIKDHVFCISLLIFTTTFFVSYLNHVSSDSDFKTIEVQSGDSLWKLAIDYSEYHNLSKQEFIKWVEKENKLDSEKLVIGQQLSIPVNEEIHQELMAKK